MRPRIPSLLFLAALAVPGCEGGLPTGPVSVAVVPTACMIHPETCFDPMSVKVGASLQLSLQATGSNGSISYMGGEALHFKSSNPAVATVTAAGLVTGVGVGSVTISAGYAGKSSSATVTVLSPTGSFPQPDSLLLATSQSDP